MSRFAEEERKMILLSTSADLFRNYIKVACSSIVIFSEFKLIILNGTSAVSQYSITIIHLCIIHD